MIKVAPSILTADFLNLGRDIGMLNACADYIHLDIMDGTFVPNISFGFPVVKAISGIAAIPMDAHLMTVHPERWFRTLAEYGVGMVSFHLDAAGKRCLENIREIHSLGMKAGIAVNPDIDIKRLYQYIGEADFFLVMSVFAGFGGQKFIYESLDRIAGLRAEIDKCGAQGLIEVDGGIGVDNAGAVREAGADIIVAGSSVFSSENPFDVVEALKKA